MSVFEIPYCLYS